MQLSATALTFAHETVATTNPAAQTVNITTSGSSAIAWNAAATTTSGGNWLQVTPTSGNTPGSISVSVIPTGLAAGTYQGTVTVSSSGAGNSPQTVNVTLNVTTPAPPQVSGISNGASFNPTLASPGLIITIRGTNLGPAQEAFIQVNAQGFAETTLANTRVLFDGTPAPIIYTSAQQVNAVVPYEVSGRLSTRVQVEYRGQRSQEIVLQVAETAPAIFSANSTGRGQGAVLNQTGALNGPNNPEQRGRVIVIYATGMGVTNPGTQTGRIVTAAEIRPPLSRATVWIAGQQAEIQYVGSAPGLIAGAVQINAVIPMTVAPGTAIPIEVQFGGIPSPGGITVAIQ
jgi:uncharacterized protein (TIGR03437 family)